MRYSFKQAAEMSPNVHEFHGPGLSRFANIVWLQRACDAPAVARMLARAFEAGREAKATEIRDALGVTRRGERS